MFLLYDPAYEKWSEFEKKQKALKNTDSTTILCETAAVFYQLNNHLKWKMSILWVRNVPVKEEDKQVKYVKWHKFERRDKDLIYERQKQAMFFRILNFHLQLK